DSFGMDKVRIGRIHFLAFPGAQRYRGAAMEAIYGACMRDAEACVEGGRQGLISEKQGDGPGAKTEGVGPETTGLRCG
ncbi:BtpA family membrane complex biogenesis protein, partial [Rhizobium ruizarguesonis]